MALIDEVAPLEGARELIAELKERGHTVVLASSAKPTRSTTTSTCWSSRELVDGWTTSGDVEQTKPQPDLVARGAREGRRRRRGHDRRLDVGLRGRQARRRPVDRRAHRRLQPRGAARSRRRRRSIESIAELRRDLDVHSARLTFPAWAGDEGKCPHGRAWTIEGSTTATRLQARAHRRTAACSSATTGTAIRPRASSSCSGCCRSRAGWRAATAAPTSRSTTSCRSRRSA